MGRYTINEDPRADKAVKEVLDMVVEGIVNLFGEHIQAIVLIGGYGRGEGGVIKIGDGYRLVNDLDVTIFINKNIYKIKNIYNDRLNNLIKEFYPKANGLKQIDIDITNTTRFRFLPNKVSYYEIKFGYQVIYGNIDLDSIMPEFKPEKLPIFDGTIYFFSRGSGLLIPTIYFIKKLLKNKENQEYFQIELQKACQAMGDALLLITDRYHFSYQERFKRFQSLIPENNSCPQKLIAKIAPFYKWGVERKLNPLFEFKDSEDVQDIVKKWYDIREVFGEFFLWYESERLERTFNNWMDYSKYVSNSNIRQPLDIKLREIIKNSVKERKLNLKTKIGHLLPVLPLLLFGLETNDGRCNKIFLDHAWHMLELPQKETKTWLFAVKAYLSEYHPGGIVEKALEMTCN